MFGTGGGVVRGVLGQGLQHTDVWKQLRMDHRLERTRVGKKKRAEVRVLGRARVEEEESAPATKKK